MKIHLVQWYDRGFLQVLHDSQIMHITPPLREEIACETEEGCPGYLDSLLVATVCLGVVLGHKFSMRLFFLPFFVSLRHTRRGKG